MSLLNILQAASNAVAGNVAGPVDLLAMGLRGVGVPVGDAPVGGTEWMRRLGLIRDVPQGASQVVGETLGLLGPIAAAAKAPQIAQGLLAVAGNAAAPRAAGPAAAQRGAIVWHGSPHKFDKFDSSKIGTGEGRQQQGIGSYLAEAKGVAQKYADKESWKLGMESGYLYKVDAPDSMIASMANHDLPLSAQPGNVRSAVMSILDADTKKALRDYHGWNDPLDAPFAAVLDALEIAKGNNRAAASESLRNAGIPGIRYLDGGSRGAGSGTSNFVVFPGEESALRILERNGMGLLGQ